MESSEDEDADAREEEAGDLEEHLVGAATAATKSTVNYRVHFLYACTFSGKDKNIKNNLPGAVAVLSNSKRLFLGHINVMLECADPRLVELCYIDTDSCIFSMTHPDWEDCVRPDRLQLWNSRRVMADESADASCHGQMKCEGTYRAGLFKTLKIYRLFDLLSEARPYTRCKGVSRYLAEKLQDEAFDSRRTQPEVVSRTCLRPTASGQINLTRESRKLAVAYNLKRKVAPDGIHTFPVSFVLQEDRLQQQQQQQQQQQNALPANQPVL